MMIMKTFEKSFIKNQSAMEYLMTYGWSILIIAVVLGALSFLGVFNPITFAPKANPGSCQIVKNTQLGISNLVGSCNNQVPQYVAQFNGNSYVNVSIPVNTPQITVILWFKASTFSSGNPRIIANGQPDGSLDNGFELFVNNGGGSGAWCVGNATSLKNSYAGWNKQLSTSTWYMYAGTYSGITGNTTVFLNGKPIDTHVNAVNSISSSHPINIGRDPNYNGDYFYGQLANIQIYNVSFSSSTISSIYQNGVGGVPIDLQNLVAWWPLNGNANDYSGNNNNGVPTNVVFTSNWYNGYTQP